MTVSDADIDGRLTGGGDDPGAAPRVGDRGQAGARGRRDRADRGRHRRGQGDRGPGAGRPQGRRRLGGHRQGGLHRGQPGAGRRPRLHRREHRARRRASARRSSPPRSTLRPRWSRAPTTSSGSAGCTEIVAPVVDATLTSQIDRGRDRHGGLPRRAPRDVTRSKLERRDPRPVPGPRPAARGLGDLLAGGPQRDARRRDAGCATSSTRPTDDPQGAGTLDADGSRPGPPPRPRRTRRTRSSRPTPACSTRSRARRPTRGPTATDRRQARLLRRRRHPGPGVRRRDLRRRASSRASCWPRSRRRSAGT